MLVTPPVRRRRQPQHQVVANTAARRLVAPYQAKLRRWHLQLAVLQATYKRSEQTGADGIKLAAVVTDAHRNFKEELVRESAPLVDNGIVKDVQRAFERLVSRIGALS